MLARFAPSPTGDLHAGNIYSYLLAWLIARLSDAQIILRIEDLDRERSREEYSDRIIDDLARLGLTWDIGPIHQSDRLDIYDEYISRLSDVANIYDCFCTRAEIRAASAPHIEDRIIYAGTCRHLSEEEHGRKMLEARSSCRRPGRRLEVPNIDMTFVDEIQGEKSMNLLREMGDTLLVKSDGGYAYQFAVAIDDGVSNIDLVTRGADLVPSTFIQIYIQSLLGLDIPRYQHIPMLCSKDGSRLSKRNKDASLDELSDQYGSIEGVLGHISYIGRLIDHDESVSAKELLEHLDLEELYGRISGIETIEFN